MTKSVEGPQGLKLQSIVKFLCAIINYLKVMLVALLD